MESILAKSSSESLTQHTTLCLKAAKALLDNLPLSYAEKHYIEEDVLLSVALHDVGKAASGFQSVLKSLQKDWRGCRHEVLSAMFASSLPQCSASVIFAILTHHKCLPSDGVTSNDVGSLPIEQIPWKGDISPILEQMINEWMSNVEPFKIELENIRKIMREYKGPDADGQIELKPLTIDVSWLNRGTGNRSQLRNIPFEKRYRTAFVRGLTIAADHLGSANRIPPKIPRLKDFDVLTKRPRPFQKHAGKLEGSAILRAPTGSGKTEAALLWAQKNQRDNGRLFYVLPYTASINAMYHRLCAIFGMDNVGLLHSRATSTLYHFLETSDDPSSKLATQQNALALTTLAREIWFPIRVCTPHQILRYMLRGKGWEALLAEFPNASFIFDEVHAYDPRVVGLTLGSMRLLRKWGARSLYLSATLPNFLLKLIEEAVGEVELITPKESEKNDKEILDQKRHLLKILDGNIIDNLDIINKAISSHTSTLIVCNTVGTAQDLFDRLKEADKVLLHSRFNQEDRNRIENKITLRKLPKVLVATQVVEVSLDVDFDCAFLEPAPIDAMIQRMGRVNRSGHRKPALITIFMKQVNPHPLYRPKLVQDSIQQLSTLTNPISEKDLALAADTVYRGGYIGEDKSNFDQGFNHPDIVEFEQRLLAGAHQPWVEQLIDNTDGSIEVLPHSLRDKYDNRMQKGLWIEANALFVPVRIYYWKKVKNKLKLENDFWIINCSYSSDRGLVLYEQ